MAKVITLSRTFPTYHQKAGQKTFFVEQVLNALGINPLENSYSKLLESLNKDNEQLSVHDLMDFQERMIYGQVVAGQKLHTIRAKSVNKMTVETYSRWKQGDKASLRVWSGKPYNSPQIIIAPDVELVRVLDFTVTGWGNIWVESETQALTFKPDSSKEIHKIAQNDGLATPDLLDWFQYPNPFDGQILCWKEVFYV